MGNYAEFYDQLRTREGWRFTEDLSFNDAFSVTPGFNGATTKIPVQFANLPNLNQMQQAGATAAYLVLRRLSLAVSQTIDFRLPNYLSLPSQDLTFSALGSTTGGLGTIQFILPPGGVPAGGSGISQTLALRRIQLLGVPANVTINGISVKAIWSSGVGAFSSTDLHVGPFTAQTVIDLAQYFDAQLGLVNKAGTEIDVIYNYTNTGVGAANVNSRLYGSAQGVNWLHYRVQYQDWNGGLHNIGYIDILETPVITYQLDQLIPIPLTDPGQNNTQNAFGNILLTQLNIENFYGLSGTPFDLMLTATVAYLLPYTGA